MRGRLRAAKLTTCITLAVVLVGLPSVTLTRSAVMYRIWTEPSEPIVGEPTSMGIATFWPDSQVGSDGPKPLALPDFPWSFVADSPTGISHAIALNRVSGSGNEWSGTFSFDEAGHWEVGLDLRHLGTPVDPGLGARVPVIVRAAQADQDPGPIVLMIGIGLGMLLAAGWVIAYSRRR